MEVCYYYCAKREKRLTDVEHASLSELINYLERGNRMHICVAFQNNFGNRKTLCAEPQTIHNCPVCMAAKKKPEGLSSCFRCRMAVQKYVIRHRRSLGGYCINGVYEYCRPVIYQDNVICVLYVGNIFSGDAAQLQRLEERVDSSLIETMENSFSYEDCSKIADILESYILLLFDRYGMENKTFDPLVENIKNYIRENLVYDVSMEDLAAVFGYTPKHLGRLFKQRTGYTVSQYCNQEKIVLAKRLLTETEMDIDRIASESGFGSTTYFDRVFHKIQGCTPQMFRKMSK